MLPNTKTTVETLMAKQEATDTVTKLLERNVELEEIFQVLQPLLYTLSETLYPSDDPVSLGTLVADAVEYLTKENLQ